MQIGPRIRVGGSLGHFGEQLKHVAGQGARIAAPIVSMANPLLGAGIAAAGGALRGKSIADIVKEAAITGGTGYALGKVGGFFSGGSGEAAGELAPGGVATAAPAEMNIDGEILSSAAKAAPKAAGNIVSRAGSAAVNYAKHNPKDLAIGAGYAANAVLQNSAQNNANRINERQIALQEREYNDQKRLEEERQARLDPVRAMLEKWLANRFGQTGAAV